MMYVLSNLSYCKILLTPPTKLSNHVLSESYCNWISKFALPVRVTDNWCTTASGGENSTSLWRALSCGICPKICSWEPSWGEGMEGGRGGVVLAFSNIWSCGQTDIGWGENTLQREIKTAIKGNKKRCKKNDILRLYEDKLWKFLNLVGWVSKCQFHRPNMKEVFRSLCGFWILRTIIQIADSQVQR